jgi:ADP-ribosylglycohydrolase
MEAAAYTDDTIHALLICWAIGNRQGRITAEDLARVWIEHADLVLDLWYTEQISLYRWALAGVPAVEAGQHSIPADNTVIGIAPIGLVNAGDPALAASDAREVAGLLNGGYSRTAAGTVAAAVAAAFTPGATPATMVQAALAESEPEMRGRLARAVELASSAGSESAFVDAAYRELLVEWPHGHRMMQLRGTTAPPGRAWGVDVREVVPVALGLFLLHGGAPERVIPACVNFGRDCDSIASIGGQLSGVYAGVGALPEGWRTPLLAASPFDLRAAADGVESALRAELGRCAERAGLLHSR